MGPGRKPRQLEEPGILFFFTKNLESMQSELVGIYGNARVEEKFSKYVGFDDDEFFSNLSAEKEMSLRFPVPLSTRPYLEYVKKRQKTARALVGQAGIRYIQQDLAKIITTDEIEAVLKNPSGYERELDKLYSIYKLITGSEYDSAKYVDNDETEQDYVSEAYARKSTAEIYQEMLSDDKRQMLEYVEVNGRRIKRSNRDIWRLKAICGHKCEICRVAIPTKRGGFSIDAAHITPKNEGGETSSNLMILCPNHHREFDKGNRIITERTTDMIRFVMNGKKYKIDLKLSKRRAK